MAEVRGLHPWVEERREKVTFGIQLIASKDHVPGPALIEAAKHADSLGYDAVFLGDHPSWSPECYLHFAAMAMVTENVYLGPMVAASPYRNPVLMSRLVSDLDHLSGGRCINGLGIGWNASEWEMGTNEFDRMGIPYPSARMRQEAMEEAIAVMRGAWGNEPFSFKGEHYEVDGVNVPSPAQSPEPPFVLAGGGKRTLNQVARLADMSNFGSGPAGGTDSLDVAGERLATLRSACESIGRDPDDVLHSHFMHWLMVAPDQASIDQKVKKYFPDGLTGFWGEWLVALSVEDAIAYFKEYIDIGMQYFVFQNLDPSGDTETTELVKREIEPALRA